MDCRRTGEMLSRFLDGELPEDAKREVRRHVSACAKCAADLETLSRAWDEVGRLPLVTSRLDLWPQIEGRLPAKTGWASVWAAWSGLRLQAAAVVVVGLLVGGWLGGSTFTPRIARPQGAETSLARSDADLRAFSDVIPGSLADIVLRAAESHDDSGNARGVER